MFVPSKGRAGNSATLSRHALPSDTLWIVVEPQEFEAYRAAYPKHQILVLPENDKGIAYVRNWILDYATDRFPWYWMLDDDISFFFRAPFETEDKTDMTTALLHAQALPAQGIGVGQVSIDYKQFAYRTFLRRQIMWNSYCDVCVGINTEAVKKSSIRYRNIGLKEDRDFTLQILASGFNTLRDELFGFDCPMNGSNAGGLKELYDQEGREEREVRRMQEFWPGVVQVQKKPNGRIDCHIAWKRFRRFTKI